MFSPAMQRAVDSSGRCFRAYLKLTTCDERTVYLRSHPDVLTPPGETSTAEIMELSASSQGVDFEESRTTIGDFSFRVVDIDDTLTDFIASLDTCSLGGTRVQYFAGYEQLGCEEFHCVQTTIINRVSFKGKGYTFNATDPSRLGRTEIFPKVTGKMLGDVYDDQTRPNFAVRPNNVITEDGQTINVNGLLLNETNDAGNYGFFYVEQDEPFSASPDGKTYVVYECEILEVELVGQSVFPQQLLDLGRFVPEIKASAYRVIDRTQFATTPLEVSNDGLVMRNESEICQSVTLKGSAPDLLHQIMTGKNIDGTDAELPDGYHAEIDLDYVKSESFSAFPEYFNDELEFVNPKAGDAKSFWEEQILRWLDAYLLIDCEGRFCLRPHDEPTENDNARIINESHVLRCGEIDEDTNVTTSIALAWDKDPCEDQFLSTESMETGSQTLKDRCLVRKVQICRFEGVRTNNESARAIRNRACQWLSRRISPKWSLPLTLCIDQGDLLPGDKVRVQLDRVRDYNSPQRSLNRVFEIRNVTWDFQLGVVEVDLCTRAKAPDPQLFSECLGATGSCGRNHCQGRRILDVQGGVIPAGTTLTVPPGEYCHDGDLRIDGVLRMEGSGNLGLIVNGTLSGTGLIDTSGQGFNGGQGQTAFVNGSSFVGRGWGTNNSQGGAVIECFGSNNDLDDRDVDTSAPDSPGTPGGIPGVPGTDGDPAITGG